MDLLPTGESHPHKILKVDRSPPQLSPAYHSSGGQTRSKKPMSEKWYFSPNGQPNENTTCFPIIILNVDPKS